MVQSPLFFIFGSIHVGGFFNISLIFFRQDGCWSFCDCRPGLGDAGLEPDPSWCTKTAAPNSPEFGLRVLCVFISCCHGCRRVLPDAAAVKRDQL